MATYLDVINSVLVKLREPKAATVTDNEYTLLIGQLVNQAMSEVQDAWNWSGIRDEMTITTSSSIEEYTLTGSSDKTKIAFLWNDTMNTYVHRKPWDHVEAAYKTPGTPTGTVSQYAQRSTSAGELTFKFLSKPTSAQTISVFVWNPQQEMSLTGSDDSTVIKVPSLPIILGAYALAVEERGEDGGVSSNSAHAQYLRALGDAIAIDASRSTGEEDWQVV